MPRHQFALYEIRVRKIQEPKSYRQVYCFNPRKDDLFEIYTKFLVDGIGTKGATVERSERYARLHSMEEDRRTLWFTVESGRYGTRGKVVDTETGDDAYEIQDDDAAAYPLRQALFVPTVGDFALWATEVIGHTSAIGSLTPMFRDWFKERYDSERLSVDINYFQDTNAWTKFIEESSLQEITYITRERDGEDRSVGTRVQEHRIKAARRLRLPREWITRAIEKRLPPDSVFSVSGLPEADEVRLQIERGGRSRTIVVDRDWPRFNYALEGPRNGPPGDEVFRREVLSEVGASLDYLGADRGAWMI
ncbi:hypothetical protein [Streptomyces cyanogenus]|uniref:Uncharacterized protein n=1 Tax=Streptomyces cyanogenus TaxID=80860 RepID=A0ABX7U1Q0_STRCY|nr:hypothetical protein [Streptomyces cyanogenus]QTE00875.1 hypothetical protein S1361_26320 [Streptomyces cyanogenus]